MRVLLTGSSGFIGTYLGRALRETGHHVVGLDRDKPDWSAPDEFVHGDILDDGVLEEAFDRSVACVVHLAAAKDDWGLSRQEYFRDNVRATERLLSVGAGHGIAKWFHYSTVGVLASGAEPVDESAPYKPETAYGASKAEAEMLFTEFGRDDPTAEVMILRPSAVFGPRNPPTTNVHRLVEAILGGRFVMVGDGKTPKTTSYIENLVEATLFLLDEMRPGVQTFHYVDQPVMTTEYLVGAIYRHASKDRPRWRVPLPFARTVAYASDIVGSLLGMDFPITAARIEKFCRPTNFGASAIRDLGFRQPVPNAEAVARTVRWHLKRRED